MQVANNVQADHDNQPRSDVVFQQWAHMHSFDIFAANSLANTACRSATAVYLPQSFAEKPPISTSATATCKEACET